MESYELVLLGNCSPRSHGASTREFSGIFIPLTTMRYTEGLNLGSRSFTGLPKVVAASDVDYQQPVEDWVRRHIGGRFRISNSTTAAQFNWKVTGNRAHGEVTIAPDYGESDDGVLDPYLGMSLTLPDSDKNVNNNDDDINNWRFRYGSPGFHTLQFVRHGQRYPVIRIEKQHALSTNLFGAKLVLAWKHESEEEHTVWSWRALALVVISQVKSMMYVEKTFRTFSSTNCEKS